jgi:hypothetical protein
VSFRWPISNCYRKTSNTLKSTLSFRSLKLSLPPLCPWTEESSCRFLRSHFNKSKLLSVFFSRLAPQTVTLRRWIWILLFLFSCALCHLSAKVFMRHLYSFRTPHAITPGRYSFSFAMLAGADCIYFGRLSSSTCVKDYYYPYSNQHFGSPFLFVRIHSFTDGMVYRLKC